MGSVEHDLRVYEAQQARGESIYEHYSNGVIERLVDKALAIKTMPLGCPSIVGMVVDGELDCVDLTLAAFDTGILGQGARNRLQKTVSEKVREWCEGEGSDYVMQLCREDAA